MKRTQTELKHSRFTIVFSTLKEIIVSIFYFFKKIIIPAFLLSCFLFSLLSPLIGLFFSKCEWWNLLFLISPLFYCLYEVSIEEPEITVHKNNHYSSYNNEGPFLGYDQSTFSTPKKENIVNNNGFCYDKNNSFRGFKYGSSDCNFGGFDGGSDYSGGDSGGDGGGGGGD